LKRFSVEYYREVLSAWKTGDDNITATHESAINTCAVDHHRNGSTRATDDHVIDIDVDDSGGSGGHQSPADESFESIPESPLIVEKRFSDRQPPKTSKGVTKGAKNRCLAAEFIHFEADVELDSSEAFVDDIEDTQRELLEMRSDLSCVTSQEVVDSQPIGQLIGGIDSRSAEDMRSVYLRSIADQRVGVHRKYKLQYNYDTNIDVYSQEPTDEELMDYEFDSFCVPNDCVLFDDNSAEEVDTKAVADQSPSPQMTLRSKRRKRFKRIIFSP